MDAKTLRGFAAGSKVIDYADQIFIKSEDKNYWVSENGHIRTNAQLAGCADLLLDDETIEFLSNTFYKA